MQKNGLNTKKVKVKTGRKPQFFEKSKPIAFRCPISKINELKLVVEDYLKQWRV